MSLRIRDIKIEDYKEISKIRKMPGVMENILSNKDEEEELIKEKIINRGKISTGMLLKKMEKL
ncbi:hypothetical protein ACRTAD_001656 [Clostridium perfringens]